MPKIQLTLEDTATGRTRGPIELAAEQLPEAFDQTTTLTIGDADWLVERATPSTRAEASACGQLHLVLRRIETVDPKTILFSLPTIDHALPPGEPGDGAAALRLAGDDWRQLELVAARWEPEVAAELAAIRRIHTEQRAGVGFKELHVRQRIAEPLAGCDIEVEELWRVLGDPARRAVAVHDEPGVVVAGGFAMTVGDETVYGREDAGVVVVLGVARGEPPAALLAFADRARLLVVDWCAASVRYPKPTPPAN